MKIIRGNGPVVPSLVREMSGSVSLALCSHHAPSHVAFRFHRSRILSQYPIVFPTCLFSQVIDLFFHLKIAMFSQSYYYSLKKDWLDKIVWLVWSDCQVRNIHISRDKIEGLLRYLYSQKTEIACSKERQIVGIPTKLAGDGQFDSRGDRLSQLVLCTICRILGFTAYYCNYVFLDLQSSKVLAFWVADKNMV